MKLLKFALISMLSIQCIACIHPMKQIQLKNSEKAKKILIAGKSSQFKDTIRENIVAHYKNDCDITIIPSDRLSMMDVEKYDAIILMEMTLAWGGFNTSMTSFLDSLPDTSKQKVVLFMTSADPDWKYSYDNIDAITSASDVGRINELTGTLEKRIDSILTDSK